MLRRQALVVLMFAAAPFWGSVLSAIAEPLDKESCANLQVERKKLLTKDMQHALEHGPDWVKDHLDKESIDNVYQQVYVPPGATVRASAWAWLHVCGDPSNDNPPGCGSDPNSGAGVRIGIDPDGGGDPNAAEIVWSRFATPHDRWGQVSVETQARGPVVTLMLFTHQHNPKAFNTMYWDSAYLEYVP